MDHGEISRSAGIEVVSEMAEGGLAFADGIESDRIEFSDGQTLRVRLADRRLALVVEAKPARMRSKPPSSSTGSRPRRRRIAEGRPIP